MLFTCPYCGRIHDKKHDCGKRPARLARHGSRIDDREAEFRRTEAWKRKSIRIRERDHYLCQVCLRGLYQFSDGSPLTYDGVSVHHAVPLTQAWDARLSDDNLLTLCSLHHEMAERGEIPLKEIRAIIREQENSGAAGPKFL